MLGCQLVQVTAILGEYYKYSSFTVTLTPLRSPEKNWEHEKRSMQWLYENIWSIKNWLKSNQQLD